LLSASSTTNTRKKSGNGYEPTGGGRGVAGHHLPAAAEITAAGMIGMFAHLPGNRRGLLDFRWLALH
jgi:hypothetical protein